MGMLIDEAIINLHAMQGYYNNDMLVNYVGFDRKDNESVDVAIDTMRKYQKIEQIVNAELEEYHPLDRNIYRLALIRKVLEDGDVD